MDAPDCPIHDCQRILGGKWTLVILWHLRSGTKRFAELQRAIATVSEKALTENLRHLERERFVTRTVFPEVPPRVEYALTPLGRSFLPVIDAIDGWVAEHRGELAPPVP